MSLRCITSCNNLLWLMRYFARSYGHGYSAVAVVLPQKFALRSAPSGRENAALSSLGTFARRILIDDRMVIQSADWRRFITSLFFGSERTLRILKLSFTGVGLLAQERDDEKKCLIIQKIVSRFPWKFSINTSEIELYNKDVQLKDLDLGLCIGKGSSAVVYEAKFKYGEFLDHLPFGSNYPFAVKMMFNYHIRSNSMDILHNMYNETLPSQLCNIEHVPLNQNMLFKAQTLRLPAHPNIVTMYNVFADLTPDMPGAMDNYPDALPTSINPQGYGRNMTLFLLMKRYQYTLSEYVHVMRSTVYSSLLFGQLLEAIVHMRNHGVAHRDLKSDNILIEERTINGNQYVPLLVVSDFGCCLVDNKYGLKIPYRTEGYSKGGNIRLMAPEILTQEPGMFAVLDYRKSDLWAAGVIAYEMYGLANPFAQSFFGLSNYTYEDNEIPDMGYQVPKIINCVVKNLLSRNPKSRLEPEIAANIVAMYIFAPNHWFDSNEFPDNIQIQDWLSCLAMKGLLEGKEYSDREYSNVEFMLMGTFLKRVKLSEVKTALTWMKKHI